MPQGTRQRTCTIRTGWFISGINCNWEYIPRCNLALFVLAHSFNCLKMILKCVLHKAPLHLLWPQLNECVFEVFLIGVVVEEICLPFQCNCNANDGS